jgi:hypothetical protein
MAPFGRENQLVHTQKRKKKAQRRGHDFDNQEPS